MKDFSNTLKAMTFSKRMLCLSGIWPLEIRDSIFISFILFGFVFNILAILDMINYIKNFSYILANVMEYAVIIMALIKHIMLRIKCRSLSQFLIETKADYTADNYKNDEERLIFLKYNKLSYRLIIILIPCAAFLTFFYSLKGVIPNILMVRANSSSEYKLSAQIKLVEPTDAKRYALDCLFELIRVIMIVSDYMGADALLISFGFHLTGQLAILKCRVKGFLNDTNDSREGIRKIILGHHRLIRLTDLLEDSFNIIIGQHLFGTTILLCVSCYRMLTSLALIETTGIITFVVFALLLMCKLFFYCYVGESLLEESSNLCDELYFCNWYELSIIDMKSIWICMMRTSKPLKLTCAKFSVLSVRAFTDILHKSMAYLSFLRTAI